MIWFKTSQESNFRSKVRSLEHFDVEKVTEDQLKGEKLNVSPSENCP